MDTRFLTASALAQALRDRQVSAAQALEEAIERIEAEDGVLNAVVVRDFDRARTAAAEADSALGRGDKRPLLGVPMTVKESFNVAGLPTTWGNPGAQKRLAQHDAVAVARLKSSGAVILGKTNIATNLGDWQSVNAVYGRTHNPWDSRRTPGGSSGGAAAALAAGFVPLELGSDLAGSLRVPAHCCGIFCHNPSHALIPTRGHAPPGTPELSVGMEKDLAVVGPLARSAADLRVALGILAGPDDAQAIAYRLALPPPRHERLSEFKVLVLEEHPLLPTSSAVHFAIRQFAAKLQDAGCIVEESSPLLSNLAAVADTFIWLQMALLGANLSDAAYCAQREQITRLLPMERNRETLSAQALVASHRDWLRAHRTRTVISHQWRQFFETWDVLICPVLPTTAFPHDDTDMHSRRIDIDGRLFPYGLQGVWAGPASTCGLPATVMPVAVSGGLPIGVQIIGPYLEDSTTIRFAELAEREFGGFTPPPDYA